ncbi:MAG: integrase catalytic domain-containing protein [Bryobacteraceae bacterium]
MRDDVYQLIADGFVHVNLAAAFLRSPSLVRVFATSEEAPNAPSKTSGVVPITAPAPHVSLSVGTCLTWRTVLWKIVNVSPTTVSLLSQQNELTELPFPSLETLICQGHIQPVAVSADQTSSPGLELLLSADERDLKEANRRAYLIGRDARGTDEDGRVAVPARTRDRWAARFRTASNVHGMGYLGLLPHTRDRGNRSPRMSEASRTLMAEFVEQDYETTKQKSIIASWRRLVTACERNAVEAPSYKTFRIAVHQRGLAAQTRKRKGTRAAYKFEKPIETAAIGCGTSVDRVFQLGHIDHTEVDIELSTTTGTLNLGRPWLTVLVDQYSRRALAYSLIFDPPSYRSSLLVLRACVFRHRRLPQMILGDSGPEFDSVYYESVLARYQCTKKTRPPSSPRFGSILERLFGTANTQLFNILKGNTQLMKEPRQATKSVNPKCNAIWTLPLLHERIGE